MTSPSLVVMAGVIARVGWGISAKAAAILLSVSVLCRCYHSSGGIMQPDDTDRRILRRLLAEPSLTVADLAERAGVTPATCGRRIEKLRAAGILKGIHAVIDWAAMG